MSLMEQQHVSLKYSIYEENPLMSRLLSKWRQCLQAVERHCSSYMIILIDLHKKGFFYFYFFNISTIIFFFFLYVFLFLIITADLRINFFLFLLLFFFLCFFFLFFFSKLGKSSTARSSNNVSVVETIQQVTTINQLA
jgi:hypothetical protein